MFKGFEVGFGEADDFTRGRCKIISEIFEKHGGKVIELKSLKEGDQVITGTKTGGRFKSKHIEALQSDLKFYLADWISDSVKANRLQDIKAYSIKIVKKEKQPMNTISTEQADGDDEMNFELPECQRLTPLKSEHNQNLIEELEILAEARYLTGENRSHQSYRRAIALLKAYPKRITTAAEAEKLRGIGGKISHLIDEFLKNGRIEYVQQLKRDEKLLVLKEFCKIHGVGPVTANKWYQEGVRTVEEVKSKRAATLTSQQRLGLTYFKDFNTPMTREQVEAVAMSIEEEMKNCFKDDTRWHLKITGGYSRGKELSNDVDIILWPEDENKPKGKLRKLAHHLTSKHLIKEILMFHEYNPQVLKRKKTDEDHYDKVNCRVIDRF